MTITPCIFEGMYSNNVSLNIIWRLVRYKPEAFIYKVKSKFAGLNFRGAIMIRRLAGNSLNGRYSYINEEHAI